MIRPTPLNTRSPVQVAAAIQCCLEVRSEKVLGLPVAWDVWRHQTGDLLIIAPKRRHEKAGWMTLEDACALSLLLGVTSVTPFSRFGFCVVPQWYEHYLDRAAGRVKDGIGLIHFGENPI